MTSEVQSRTLFGIIAKRLKLFGIPFFLSKNIPDEGYSKASSCSLNYIFTFFLHMLKSLTNYGFNELFYIHYFKIWYFKWSFGRYHIFLRFVLTIDEYCRENPFDVKQSKTRTWHIAHFSYKSIAKSHEIKRFLYIQTAT